MDKKTYRDYIKEQIRATWSVYEMIGELRDIGTVEEKHHYNRARGGLYDAAMELSKLDNGMTKERAGMVIENSSE